MSYKISIRMQGSEALSVPEENLPWENALINTIILKLDKHSVFRARISVSPAPAGCLESGAPRFASAKTKQRYQHEHQHRVFNASLHCRITHHARPLALIISSSSHLRLRRSPESCPTTNLILTTYSPQKIYKIPIASGTSIIATGSTRSRRHLPAIPQVQLTLVPLMY